MNGEPLRSSGKYKYTKKGKYRQVHRNIMHEIDPRDNEHELDVHHIDGNKSNNSPDNLMWMTKSEHQRYHKTGENHFPCDGENNANYRHGMCVGGNSKEYVRIKNHKSYLANRETRLAKQNEYGAQHREHKRWYDKVRYWESALLKASTEERKMVCKEMLSKLKEAKA